MLFDNEGTTGCINEEAMSAINEEATSSIKGEEIVPFCFLFHVLMLQ